MRSNSRRLLLSLLPPCLPLLAQQPVHYRLRIVDTADKLAEVTATFPTAGKEALELFLPRWSPGFYRVEDYHRHVLTLTAKDGEQAIPCTQPQPGRWHLATGGAAQITVAWTLRCNTASVTGNQIAQDFAVFCGPATFLGEVSAPPRPHIVHVQLPDGWRNIATGLPENPGDPANDYVARDYDWLVDSPIVLGTIATTAFDVLGARHEWAQFGDAGTWTGDAIAPTLQKIAGELCATFGAVPFSRYVFLAGFRQANGGLEHLDSTLLSVSRRQQPDDASFLSFVAHEYAHAFNVKRLRPVELGPFDYENPPTTDGLWIAEGLTTWFGDLALVRSGVVDTAAWLRLVSGHIASLQRSPGRRMQTLADASRSVWTGTTSGVGGDPRKTISYYVKGPVVGLVLEARLRTATAGRAGLDELIRQAYARYSGERGFTHAEFEALATAIAGTDQTAFFDRAVRGTDELDYTETLSWFGLRWPSTEADAPKATRWRLEVDPTATAGQQSHLATLLAPTPAPRLPK
ncbi:MAG: M61 family metallopeptidase [Planctomycetes bacterium]|nr:M61 family metallopeptidase [Planctomycetota bacterium]